MRRGEGDHGVVLAHGAAFDAASWEKRAVAIADQGAGVIAIENIDPDAIRAAVEQLQGEGVADVAYVGASAGADAVLDLASREPGPADQLIRLAPNAIVEGLGEEPKDVVDSVDEAVAQVSTDLPESSAGEENLVVILTGLSPRTEHLLHRSGGTGPRGDAPTTRAFRFSASPPV